MNKYIEKTINLYENSSDLQVCEEIIEAINDLYSEGEENSKHLPEDLNKYAGTISVAYTLLLVLRKKLKDKENIHK